MNAELTHATYHKDLRGKAVYVPSCELLRAGQAGILARVLRRVVPQRALGSHVVVGRAGALVIGLEGRGVRSIGVFGAVGRGSTVSLERAKLGFVARRHYSGGGDADADAEADQDQSAQRLQHRAPGRGLKHYSLMRSPPEEIVSK
jgi:hypothetical protein